MFKLSGKGHSFLNNILSNYREEYHKKYRVVNTCRQEIKKTGVDIDKIIYNIHVLNKLNDKRYLESVYKPANFKKDAIVLKIPLTLTLSRKGRGRTLNSPPLRGGDEGEGD